MSIDKKEYDINFYRKNYPNDNGFRDQNYYDRIKIGKNLNISCKANDGVIEGIEHKNHKWCIGLQWHPEFLITKYDSKIIKNFIDETK